MIMMEDIDMKKGVQMFTVRDYMNDVRQVKNTLKKIHEIGYDSIQAATPGFMSHTDFKKMMMDNQLETYSANADFEGMTAQPEALKDAIEQAHIYDVNYIAIGTLPEAMRESVEGYKAFCIQANKVASALKKEGLKLLYHPHALECYSFGGGLKGLDIILEDTDPEGFHFSLDTHWLASGGLDICEWIEKVQGRMELVHFKDYAIVGGAATVETVCRQFVEVGEGNLNWVKIIQVCKDTGVKALAVEQDICPGNAFDSLAKSFENLVKMGV